MGCKIEICEVQQVSLLKNPLGFIHQNPKTCGGASERHSVAAMGAGTAKDDAGEAKPVLVVRTEMRKRLRHNEKRSTESMVEAAVEV